MTDNVQFSALNKTNNKWLDVWNEFKNHKGALAGAIIFALIVILVLLGPFVWPYEANGINIRIRNQGPSLAHPLGTDQLGRDTLARIMAGGRTSITVGLTAMLLSLFLGTLIGVVAMLGNMADPKAIGPAMAVVLLTTLYGAMIANCIFMPIVTKLEGYSAHELLYREMVVMGLKFISRGESPRNITDQLVANLPPKIQAQIEEAA